MGAKGDLEERFTKRTQSKLPNPIATGWSEEGGAEVAEHMLIAEITAGIPKKSAEGYARATETFVDGPVGEAAASTANTKSAQELEDIIAILGMDELSPENQSLVENQSARLNKLLADKGIAWTEKGNFPAGVRALRGVEEEVVELCQQLGGQLHVSFHSIRNAEVGLPPEMEVFLGQLGSAMRRVDITKEN